MRLPFHPCDKHVYILIAWSDAMTRERDLLQKVHKKSSLLAAKWHTASYQYLSIRLALDWKNLLTSGFNVWQAVFNHTTPIPVLIRKIGKFCWSQQARKVVLDCLHWFVRQIGLKYNVGYNCSGWSYDQQLITWNASKKWRDCQNEKYAPNRTIIVILGDSGPTEHFRTAIAGRLILTRFLFDIH